MNTAQKNTATSLITIAAIIAFAYIFAQALAEWNAPALEPVPVPECTACGCTTETETIEIIASAL